MNRVLVKGASGLLEAKDLSDVSLKEWFQKHTDEKGKVSEEIIDRKSVV